MQEQLSVLKKSGLFNHIEGDELINLLACLGAEKKLYQKASYIISEEDRVTKLGIVLTGMVQVIKEDEFGEKIIVSGIGPGGMFAETLCCAGIKKSPVTVLSVKDSEIIFLDFLRIITTCTTSCTFHTTLIQNMLRIIANKNLYLNEKMNILTKKTTREKLMAYFHSQSKKTDKSEFSIPFNREELSDYLSVNRSAMSRELSNMREEGLIDFHKNHIKLK